MSRPVLPRNKKAPNKSDRLVASSKRDVGRRLRKAQRQIIELFTNISYLKRDADSGQVINNVIHINQDIRYDYLLDSRQISTFASEIERIIRQSLMVGQEYYLDPYMIRAYEQGTADAVVNLTAISNGQYFSTVPQVLTSQPYVDRIGFVAARSFEEMEGFVGDAKTTLARILGDGIGAGQSPRKIEREIRKAFSVSDKKPKGLHYRALRIARTEINQAHRRARWEEAQSASERLGITTKLMHLSALLPTTRKSHANRHGHVFTRQEVEEWYTVDGNAINCRCSQVEILVDSKGNPVDPGLIKRLRKDGREFFDNAKEAA